jgi:AAA family ATP:ADP antiporter
MARWLEGLLDLRPGETRCALLFSFYYFLVIAGQTTGLVARDTLFLEHYQAVDLPYADLASALMVGLFVAAYIPLARQASLRNLLAGSLLLFAVISGLFCWSVHSHSYEWKWIYPAFYVWVSILGAVTTVQVWTLANFLLTTREAKRLFGVIGSGGILGGIFSGFFAHATAKRFGTASLLMAVTLFLALCLPLVILLRGMKKGAQLESEESEEWAPAEGPRNLQQSFQLVRSSPHLRAIATLICISAIVTAIAGWQFKATAKASLVGTDSLAAFFGAFYGYTGIVSLLVQLLLTSRILHRFGLGVALFALPSALLAGSVGMLIWGTLWAATLLKGGDKVLRYSIDSSALQLLYLPVSSKVKIQAKTFIDSVIFRLGDGLAGLTLLVFATFLHFTPSQVSWISLALLGLWLATAYGARGQYVTTLRDWIQRYRLAAEPPSDPEIDRSLSIILGENPNAADPQAILHALNQLEKSQRPTAHPALRGLLNHPSPEVCQKVLSMLSAAGDKAVLPDVQRLLHDEHSEVRAKALSYFGHHAPVDPLASLQDLSLYPQSSIRSAMVSFLAHSGEADNLETARLMLDAMVSEEGADGQKTRLAAARLMGSLPDCFEEQLRQLLEDPDSEVESAAIGAVGKLRKRRFVPHLLERLSDPRVQPVITKALGKFGNAIVGTLRDHLLDSSVRIQTRRAIPDVLVRIGTPEAGHVLAECLLEADTVLRLRMISSMNKLRHSHPEVELDTTLMETVLAGEIMGHYRSYQILGTLGGQIESDDTVGRALDESMRQEIERIFRLMQLLFPRHDLHSAYFGLQSKDPMIHDNALEFLDNILKPQMRRLLVPLLDSDVSVAERVSVANRLVGAKVETGEEAVHALMESQDPWLQACGAYAIGVLGLKSLEHELDSHLNDPDVLLQEAVRQAKARLAARYS